MKSEDYKLIPMSEITDEAREIAVAWMECEDKDWIGQKHKLASDIMNYAKKHAIDNLSLRLKTEIIKYLTKNPHYSDDPYLMIGEIQYSKREIADEIEKETKIGIKLLTDMIVLAIDITARGKNNK
jgi:hypothetical protein